MRRKDQGHPSGHGRLAWTVRLLVAVMVAAAVAVSIFALVIGLRIGASEIILHGTLIGPLLVIFYSIVGVLILVRYPRHGIGWLLLAIAFVFLSGLFAGIPTVLADYGRLSHSGTSARLADWTGLWLWIPQLILPVIFLPLYFPTGELLSQRWRIVSAVGLLGMVGGMVAAAVHPVYETDDGTFPNPFTFPGGEAIGDFLNTVVAPLLFAAMVGALASMVVRYRRANAEERLQIKWLFYPIGIAIIWWLGGRETFALIAPQLSQRFEGVEYIPDTFWLLMFAIPIAIGIAILRYRLLDIDVIIRRTLIYGFVTVLLAAVYFGSVVLLQQLSAVVIGEQSPVIIVISTLLIAALSSPLYGRVQRFIDRSFYRARYDAAQTLSRFAQTARDETDLEALTAKMVSVVQTTVQLESVSVWLRPVERSRGAGALNRKGAKQPLE